MRTSILIYGPVTPVGQLEVDEDVVGRLDQDPRPVDRVDAAEVVLLDEIPVCKHLLAGDVQIVRSAIHYWQQ